MTILRAIPTVSLAMLLLAGPGTWSSAQEKPAPVTPAPKAGVDAGKGTKAKAGAADKEAAPAPAPVTQGLSAFGKVLPVGEKNEDVKIPSFKDGLPSSTVRAGSMTRVDDANMSIERMDIRLFGPTHERDVRIQLVTALYNMPSQILSSETRSRVSRADFDLQGDSMIFDTRTQQGKMVGNVRMVIYDADSFAPPPPKSGTSPKTEKPEAAATPSKTASPSPPANEKK